MGDGMTAAARDAAGGAAGAARRGAARRDWGAGRPVRDVALWVGARSRRDGGRRRVGTRDGDG
eukprot:gene8294-17330_t